MSVALDRRPAPDDYAPFYARYVALVPDGDIVATLERQGRESVALLRGLGARAGQRYAPGKWSVRDVIGHMGDSECVFAFRLLSFARGDAAELPGFDEDEYARAAAWDRLALERVVDHFASARAATLSLLGSLDEAAWGRSGVANGARVSVHGLAWIMAGHELHHLGVLRERYLV